MNKKLFVSLFVALFVVVSIVLAVQPHVVEASVPTAASTAISNSFASCRINQGGSFDCVGIESFSCPSVVEGVSFSEATYDGSCNYRGQSEGNNVLISINGTVNEFASCVFGADGFVCDGNNGEFSCPAVTDGLSFSEAMTDGSCNYRGQSEGNNTLVTVAGQ